MSTTNPENETLSAAEELIDEDDFVLDEASLEASLNSAANETEEDDTADEPSAAGSQSVSNAASAAQVADLEAKISGLIAELTTVKEQSEDRKGQYTRLYADFENFTILTTTKKPTIVTISAPTALNVVEAVSMMSEASGACASIGDAAPRSAAIAA